MNMYFYFYFNVAREVVTVLLIFIDAYHYTQAHMYQSRTGGMARAGHRSLVGRGGNFILLETKA